MPKKPKLPKDPLLEQLEREIKQMKRNVSKPVKTERGVQKRAEQLGVKLPKYNNLTKTEKIAKQNEYLARRSQQQLKKHQKATEQLKRGGTSVIQYGNTQLPKALLNNQQRKLVEAHESLAQQKFDYLKEQGFTSREIEMMKNGDVQLEIYDGRLKNKSRLIKLDELNPYQTNLDGKNLNEFLEDLKHKKLDGITYGMEGWQEMLDVDTSVKSEILSMFDEDTIQEAEIKNYLDKIKTMNTKQKMALYGAWDIGELHKSLEKYKEEGEFTKVQDILSAFGTSINNILSTDEIKMYKA